MSRNLHRGFPDAVNPSAHPTFGEVVLSRRALLKAGLGASAFAALGGCATLGVNPVVGFTAVPASSDDALRVPPEYEATVLYRWGDPVGMYDAMPPFKPDASNTAAEQALQAGMHHDGMHFFPLPWGSKESGHGLLVMNHEYLDEGLLYPDGQKTWTAEKVAKAQNAVGVSVIEVRLEGGAWQVVRPSRYARRITARSVCALSGPVTGHELVRTAADPVGRLVVGTYNGCAHGWTPWGTYLTCEENWQMNFVNGREISADQRRYRMTAKGRSYRWEEFDARFDAGRHPNEFHRFGWVVEIDPYDPVTVPVKRTALGRMAHEGAACSVGRDRRVAFYMGDDASFEYVYKFVPRLAWEPGHPEANRKLLDDGLLYVARFNADGSGEWLPLVHGMGPLTAANGFRDQGEVLVRTRQAADALGATKMDRAEWIVPHPVTREVFCACSLNPERGGASVEGANPANRRAPNPYGHLVRWREERSNPAATRFQWDVFVEAGPPGGGSVKGDAFACPDGLWIDSMGTLWVQTDVSPGSLGKGAYAPLGNNQMLAVDPAKGEFRRFLTGPRGCEITGFHTTPDNRTAFVNVQHPGEVPGDRSNPDAPRALSNWPDFAPDGRPRSATVVIRRKDGGIIGT
ncbi:MAG TPA: PhoX family phosphatase [Methylomirabilota bacterium]|nr:PhoX family phosphatase [Methylomirabilota bacterium]